MVAVTSVLDFAQTIAGTVAGNIQRVLRYPVDPHERLFVPYLVTSFICAIGAYLYVRGRTSAGAGRISLVEYLFPSRIWRTRSAWLDVRYFFFHQILRVSIYGVFAIAVTSWAFRLTSRILGSPYTPDSVLKRPATVVSEIAYVIVSVAALDLIAYCIHYLQHRIPALWEFHSVHHSARVMHPLTNYREHPVDNLVYATALGLGGGLMAALVSFVLGYIPAEPAVLGVGLSAVLFNILGYHLRHSHVWLRWPGALAYVFGCPAHHQVHHSYHPDHINKNFSFMFPVWDLVFGTFHLPSTNADVRFGLDDREQDAFTSCVDLYWGPFRNLLRAARERRVSALESTSRNRSESPRFPKEAGDSRVNS